MPAVNTKPMPALFVGHGNPMNVVRQNSWTAGWARLGKSLSRPRAVLAISAHWYIADTMVTAMPYPRTIHDFGGFPPKLYEIRYNAPGDPALAEKVRGLLSPLPVGLDEGWGLDHGTWSVLYHIFPGADIPVVQLSIDRTKPARFHYETGKLLSPLRDDGILILGSGNLVHNLQAYVWDSPELGAFDWALSFERKARRIIQSGNDTELIDYREMGPDARLSIPTPDHYLPLLYVLGARREGDSATWPVEGFDGGSMSMLAVQIG